jgi:hypothetical protein
VGYASAERGTQPPRRRGRPCPPLCAISEDQRREFDEARLDASRSEKWQAAILKAEQARPRLRFVSRE